MGGDGREAAPSGGGGGGGGASVWSEWVWRVASKIF